MLKRVSSVKKSMVGSKKDKKEKNGGGDGGDGGGEGKKSKSVDAPFKPPIKGTDDMSLFDDYDEDMDIAEYHDDQRIFDEFASEIIDDSELIGS